MSANVVEFFTRLTGTPIEGGEPIRLTSAKIGAAHAWLRRNSVTYDQRVLASGYFTLENLMAGGRAVPEREESLVPKASAADAAGAQSAGVGVDIEVIANLPDASDFRTEAFYRDNFTTAEIAYAIGRANPKETLCGLWAAKEAIRKAQGAAEIATSLKSIEIKHDAAGRPISSAGHISIAHSQGFCVAICVSRSAPAPGHESCPAEQPARAEAATAPVWHFLALSGVGLSLLSLVLVFWVHAH